MISVSPTKLVFQLGEFKQPQYVIDLIQSKCIGWEYLHFNDKEMLQYISEHPIDAFPQLLDVYNKITGISIKNDLFKFVFLYINGGVFINSNAVLECNIDTIIESFTDITIDGEGRMPYSYSGFIASSRTSPLMYEAIKHIYDNNMSSEKSSNAPTEPNCGSGLCSDVPMNLVTIGTPSTSSSSTTYGNNILYGSVSLQTPSTVLHTSTEFTRFPTTVVSGNLQTHSNVNLQASLQEYSANSSYKTYDVISKTYTEKNDNDTKICVTDNGVTWLTRYNNVIPDKSNKKGVNKPIPQLKIGVTLHLPPNKESMFSNGIRQHALYYYTLLRNIGYDVYIVANDSIERETLLQNIFGIDSETLKYIDIMDIAQQSTFDIIFQLSLQVPIVINHILRKCGVKIISYKCSNDYIIQMEDALFSARPDIENCTKEHSLYDELWGLPHMINTNFYYWKTIHRCKVVEVPFLWAPTAIEQFEKNGIANGVFTDVHYKNKRVDKKIAIFEPNLNVFKWSLPALLVCENSYRSIPDKLNKVYITNVDEKLKLKLNQMLQPLNLYIDKKLSVESRYNSLYFMATYADVVVSHQWENAMNYLYMDIAWMGWPLVHNAHLCKDIGYYYEGFNYEMGGKVLTDVILNHDKNAAEYKKRNRQAIDRFLPTNKELQQKYIQLINDIFPL